MRASGRHELKTPGIVQKPRLPEAVPVRNRSCLRAARIARADVLEGCHFADSIGIGRNYHMPYRSMVPKELSNLLVAGRCFSCEPEAQRAAREIPPCMVLGQAAGAAVALA